MTRNPDTAKPEDGPEEDQAATPGSEHGERRVVGRDRLEQQVEQLAECSTHADPGQSNPSSAPRVNAIGRSKKETGNLCHIDMHACTAATRSGPLHYVGLITES